MKRSRKLLALSAFVALTAWANAQAMACCWVPHRAAPAPTRVAAESASSGSGHACCPEAAAQPAAHASVPAKPPVPSHACGSETAASPALGCHQQASPLEAFVPVSSGDLSPLLAAAAPIPAFFVIFITPESPPDSGPPGAAASPRYLALRRILV